MEHKKLTWWEYVNVDRIWIYLFLVGLIFLSGVIVAQTISPFDSLSVFIIALGVPSAIMLCIGYFIFYRGWKNYLQE